MLAVWGYLALSISQRINERGIDGFWTSEDGYPEEYPVALAVHLFFVTIINLILWVQP